MQSEDENEEVNAQNALLELNKEAIAELRNEEADGALELLKRGEALLEQLTGEGLALDRNLIIVVLYN